jgi:PAS domain S-box-containing protein
VVQHTDADLILVTTLAGVCLDASATVEWMLGVPVDQVVGKPLTTVVTALDVPTIHAMFDRVRRSGAARTTMRLHHRNGAQIWLDVSAKLLDEGDDPVVLVAGRDVTDDVVALQHLAESEQRWRLAFEHSPIGAALVSADGEIMLANASLGAMLGRRVETLVMMSLRDITHEDDVALDAAKMAELLAGGIESYTVEKRYVAADGTSLWGQMTAAAVPDLHGDVHGIIVQLP